MGRVHYAWIICIGCAMMMFCNNGIVFNIFSVFFPYIVNELQLTNTEASMLTTARMISGLLAVYLCGQYYRRVGLRSGMLTAGLCSTLGLLVYAWAKSFPLCLLAAVLTGAGYGLGATVPVAMFINRWFIRQRNLAMALCSIASSAALVGFPSFFTWSIERYGLAVSFYLVMGLALALSAAAFLLLRDTPDMLGLSAYGAEQEQQISSQQPRQKYRGSGYRKGLSMRDWSILVPCILMLGVIANTGYAHLTLLFASQHLSGQAIALALSTYGICLLSGKLLYGFLADHLGSYRCNWGYCIILILGMLAVCLTGDMPFLLYPGAAATGAGMAISIVGLVAWAGDLCESREYDDTVRRFQLLLTVGGLILNMMPGMLADRFGGSYIPAYAIMLLFSILLTAGVQLVYHAHIRQQ